MATDREIFKLQQVGQLVSTAATTPTAAIAAAHTRSMHFTKVGTENAETNVVATVMWPVNRKSRVTGIKYLTATTTASDNTDYVYLRVFKSTAGAAGVLVGIYNTHGGAQGAITANVAASFSVVANVDSIIAAGDTMYYMVTKATGTGKVVAIGTILVDLEEV